MNTESPLMNAENCRMRHVWMMKEEHGWQSKSLT